jgi:ketosteroid isomerase-like protein
MTGAGAHDRASLRDLAERYAAGVDRRDVDLFLSAFHQDGCLLVFQPSESREPRGTRRGRAELADVITRISRHDRTFHLIGNSRYEVDGDHATGEVYCEAHHLDGLDERVDERVDGGTDHIMYIRYQDAYEKAADGAWRIAERRVLVDWTETRTIAP